jgi:hypothetical protein
MSPPSSTPRSLMPAPMSRAVSNPNSIPRVSETPPVPKIPEPKSRRLTANFSNIKAKTAIPRPATAQGMNGRSVSGPAGQAAPRWRG